MVSGSDDRLAAGSWGPSNNGMNLLNQSAPQASSRPEANGNAIDMSGSSWQRCGGGDLLRKRRPGTEVEMYEVDEADNLEELKVGRQEREKKKKTKCGTRCAANRGFSNLERGAERGTQEARRGKKGDAQS